MQLIDNNIPDTLFPHPSPYFIIPDNVVTWFNQTVVDTDDMDEFIEEGTVEIYAHKISSAGELISTELETYYDFNENKWL